MTTKTCMQKHYSLRARRMIIRRLPHEPAESATVDGYSTCVYCGVSIYVGQGELSPQAGQLREHLAARADMLR